MKMTKEQMAVVESDAAMRMLNCGSGCGKTAVLGSCALKEQDRLGGNGRVVVFSLTNYAADKIYKTIQSHARDRELLRQIGVRTPDPGIECSTIHGFCLRRRRISKHGVVEKDAAEQDLLLEILQSKGLVDEHSMKTILKMYRCRQIPPAESLTDFYDLVPRDEVKGILAEMNRLKKEQGLVTFNDILVRFLKMLDKPHFLKRIQRECPVLIVDEFQDLNTVAWRILKKLASTSACARIIVAGDDAQTAFAYADASFKRFKQFRQAFSDHQEFRLTINQRSTQQIQDVSDALVRQSRYSSRKTVVANRIGDKPGFYCNCSSQAIHEHIIEEIRGFAEDGIPLDQMAVFYRFNADAFGFRRCLSKNHIPYMVFGDKSSRKGPFVRLLLAMVQIITNDQPSGAAWMEVLRNVEGLGEKQAEKVFAWLKHKQSNDFQYPRQLKFTAPLERTLRFLHDTKDNVGSPLDKLFALVDFIRSMPKVNKTVKDHILPTMAKIVHDYGLKDLPDKFNDPSYPLCFPPQTNPPYPKTYLTLSTIHRIKGGEYEVVFYLGTNDETYEDHGNFSTPKDRELELQLMNIAVTRARTHLQMYFPVDWKVVKKGGHASNPWTFFNGLHKEIFQTPEGPNHEEEQS
ncbi:Superfamily I DNA or RNA helicase [Desulfatibacillum alkenivorans DSM 16219]|jgi:superfamily I DNA/RNA helicase|uniref:DNA 3'-5' helicase n=1 Tax=Desulfatibacillum alkenivorans DSM 16219 TaxID=1121393 RepID=A0A1M6W7B3_9BACT|nr:ATP-dependent helicase [Desulfatibacillum alkenivorans]SHK89664.1 Superfamily I DNA or RNA helicase [Desulfatibacillum alkenivorans DSM 16219]